MLGSEFAVIATGPSLTQEQVDKVRAKFRVIVVNDAYQLAPWAEYLVAQDYEWWNHHKDAYQFSGRKFSTHEIPGVDRLDRNGMISNSTNSGLVAIELAKRLGATKIVLLGFDMHGSHYFGAHPEGLHNTPPARFNRFMQAMEVWRMMNTGLDVVNCTPGSALKVFRRGDLDAEISGEGPIVVNGMQGLGDGIYQRGFISQMPGCYVITPWPELYEGLDVKCIRPNTRLRTQGKNIKASEYPWHELPLSHRLLAVSYGAQLSAGETIISSMGQCLSVDPQFRMPVPEGYKRTTKKPLAVIRPVTLRREWMNSARAPDPEYIYQAAQMLMDNGFHVISVADVDGQAEWLHGQAEWLHGKAPPAHEVLHNGELSTKEMLSLVGQADLVVGGVGWIVPACQAMQVRAYIVLGGNGAHNAPEKIAMPRLDGVIEYAKPDNFCMCTKNYHECNKTITGFEREFLEYLTRQGFRKPSGKRPSVAAGNRHGLLPSEAGGYAV